MHQATRNKHKGARFETDLTAWLRDNGFPHAERLHLAGTQDRGDIAGIIDRDGDRWTVEAKNCSTLALPQWWREAETEAVNAGTLHKIVVARRHGTTDPGRAWVIQTVAEWAKDHGTP